MAERVEKRGRNVKTFFETSQDSSNSPELASPILKRKSVFLQTCSIQSSKSFYSLNKILHGPVKSSQKPFRDRPSSLLVSKNSLFPLFNFIFLRFSNSLAGKDIPSQPTRINDFFAVVLANDSIA